MSCRINCQITIESESLLLSYHPSLPLTMPPRKKPQKNPPKNPQKIPDTSTVQLLQTGTSCNILYLSAYFFPL